MAETNNNPEIRNICATIYDDEGLERFKALATQYWIVGREIGPKNGRPHYQCYGQFGRKIRWKTIQKKLKNVNFRAANGDDEKNFVYCSKDGNWEEWGTRKKQGQRTDLQKVKDMVKIGNRMEEIFDALGEPNYQQIKCAELLRKYISPKRDCKPTVTWIYGATGLGKTKWAVNEMTEKVNEDFWMSSGTLQWWDGYDMNKGIIIDDFRGSQCEFTKLLRYLDRYEVKVPIKGGMVTLMATEIIVTSCQSPKDCYDSDKINENIGQLVRRIDKILAILQNGDIIDQTELFKMS